MRCAVAIFLLAATAAVAAPATGTAPITAGPQSTTTNGTAGSGGSSAIGSAASTAGGSQSQLMQATQGMKEAPMSFNMQDLQKPGDPKRKH